MKMKSTVRIITAMIIATMTFIVSNSVNVFADEDKEIQLEVLDGEFELNDENSLDNTEPLDQIDYSDDIVLSDIESREIVMTTSDAGEEGDGWSYDSSTQTVTVTKEYITLPDAIRSDVKSVVYEGDVKVVYHYTWQGCANLERVTLPANATEIGDYAFSGCTNLSSIELPDGLKSINRFAFMNSGITSIKVPSSIAAIGERAFSNCSDLKTADLSEITLDTVSFSLFAWSESLETVKLPDGIKTIYGESILQL